MVVTGGESDTRSQEHADQRGARDAADAEERVKARHDRPSHGVLHGDRLGVHGDVHRAERGAEREQRDGEQERARGHRQERQRCAGPQRHARHHPAAAPVMNCHAGQRHRHRGAAAERQQDESERALVEPEPPWRTAPSAPSSRSPCRRSGTWRWFPVWGAFVRLRAALRRDRPSSGSGEGGSCLTTRRPRR